VNARCGSWTSASQKPMPLPPFPSTASHGSRARHLAAVNAARNCPLDCFHGQTLRDTHTHTHTHTHTYTRTHVHTCTLGYGTWLHLKLWCCHHVMRSSLQPIALLLPSSPLLELRRSGGQSKGRVDSSQHRRANQPRAITQQTLQSSCCQFY